jgi:Uma2 family endonuclease
MKAVMSSVSEEIIEWRKKTGAHQFDEMWDGVLHMPAMPSRFHQDLEWSLETWLRLTWAPLHDAKVYHEVNVASVGGWPKDYRIPDLILLLPQRFAIDRDDYFEGASDVVVEIHSPGDESYEKFTFYAKIGVPEVWVIHRDSSVPEVHRLKRRRYKEQSAGVGGWIKSTQTGIELAQSSGNKLAIRLAGNDDSRRNLPED